MGVDRPYSSYYGCMTYFSVRPYNNKFPAQVNPALVSIECE